MEQVIFGSETSIFVGAAQVPHHKTIKIKTHKNHFKHIKSFPGFYSINTFLEPFTAKDFKKNSA